MLLQKPFYLISQITNIQFTWLKLLASDFYLDITKTMIMVITTHEPLAQELHNQEENLLGSPEKETSNHINQ